MKETNNNIVWVGAREMRPSKMNPRTRIDAARIEDLKLSFLQHGFTPAVSHLLLRPIRYAYGTTVGLNGYWVHWSTSAPEGEAGLRPEAEFREHGKGGWFAVNDDFEIPAPSRLPMTEGDAAKLVAWLPKYEIVCGERRWSAARDLIAAGKLADRLPAVVQEMGDEAVLELQLVENLQRDGLTPIEEAMAFKRMLAMRDGDGATVYTAKTLAEKIGWPERTVRDRLALCRLAGTAAGKALDAGDLPPAHALLLSRLPDAKMRDKLAKRALEDPSGLGIMSCKALARMIRDDCMVDLSKANFDLADATLAPADADPETGERMRGGACNDCPQNTRNSPEEKGERGPMTHNLCMHPGCFREKTEAAHARWMVQVDDPNKGRRALSMAEAEGVFDYSGRRLAWNSGFVDLAESPDHRYLRRELDDAPTWKKLLKGQAVEVRLARDCDGKVRELVPNELAVTAAREAEKKLPAAQRVLKAPARDEKLPDDQRQAEAIKEAERREMDERLHAARIGAVVAAAETRRVPEGFWLLALDALITCADEHGDAFGIVERRGWEQGEMKAAEILSAKAKDSAQAERLALTVDLLLNLYYRDDLERALPKWAKVFGADIKAAEKAAAAEFAAERKAAKTAEQASKSDNCATCGLLWSERKDGAAEFEWNESGVATNPDVAKVPFPKPGKFRAEVRLARNEHGWHFGVRYDSKHGGTGYLPMASSLNYGTRELALKAGLLEIRENMESKVTPAAILAILDGLIAGIAVPVRETPAAKPQQKKGKGKK